MKFKPTIGTQLSGSMGGLTASHGKGGPYFRQRAIPTNPGTPAQGIVRQILGNLASLWTTALNQAQRDSWADYAANVPLLDVLGDPINVTALNMYQRSNVPRLQNGLPRVDSGPTVFNLGDFTAPTIASLTSPNSWSINFEATDAWVAEDDAAMLFFGSRNTSVGINFFKGPYRAFATQLLGDSLLPPASPFAGVNPFNVSVGNKGFLRVEVTRADGRLSQDQRLVEVAV